MYQDVLMKGQVVSRGDRICASRYEAIQPILKTYQRRFSVLDVGAAQGYFSFRIAEEFDAAVVAIEQEPYLTALAQVNDLPMVILQRSLLSEDLDRMGTCEHFGVVLALNVCHHFGADWRQVVDSLLRLGENVVIETPHPDDVNACNYAEIPALYEYVASLGGVLLAESPSHTGARTRPMWLFRSPEVTHLTRSYWDAPEDLVLGQCDLHSNRWTKLIHIYRKEMIRKWIPGLNLRTYQRMGGTFPDGGRIARQIRAIELPQIYHGDIRPWNIILDGRSAHLIDGGDDRMTLDENDMAMLERVAVEVESGSY